MKQQKRPQKQQEENLRQINEHSEIIPNEKIQKNKDHGCT